MEERAEIRKAKLALRGAMQPGEWMEKTQRLTENVTGHPLYQSASEIYCYMNYNGEAGTREILEQAWKTGKKTAIPKVLEDGTMSFFYISGFEGLGPGYAHIPEPVCPSKLHLAEGPDVLVIIPCSAFDRQGHRLGYGKGFYDRYLAEHLNYHRMVIGFGLQETENIPAFSHDIQPEVIITEEKVVYENTREG